MKVKKVKGYFYTYRGNGYGPFISKEICTVEIVNRMYSDTSDIGRSLLLKYQEGRYKPRIYFGTVRVSGAKELLKSTLKVVLK